MAMRGKDVDAITRLAEQCRCGWLNGDAESRLSLWADEAVLTDQG
jgi:hypothetical protein